MLKVIIADDEKKICQLLQILVDWGALGFEIIAIKHDGKSLLEAARELHPDVIITDIRMPGCNGLELLHRIRQEDMDIEIIIMSGYREFDYVRAALKDGAADYLLKPLGRTSVEEALLKIRERQEQALAERHHVEEMEQTLENVSKKLHEDLIGDVLNGVLVKAAIDELNRDYHSGFHQKNLYFATVKIDLADDLSNKVDDILRQKARKISKGCMLRHDLQYLDFSRDNLLFLLINGDSYERVERCLYQIIHELRDLVCQLDGGHVTAGTAQIEDGELQHALQRSLFAARDQVFRGDDKVLEAQDHPQDIQAADLLSRKDVLEMQHALVGLSVEGLRKAVGNACRAIQVATEPTQSGELVFQTMCRLQETLSDACRYLYADDRINIITERYRKRLNSCHDYLSYENLLQEEQRELMDVLADRQRQMEKKPIRQMKQLIEEHYQEPLTLEDVSEWLKMSPAYVSRLFRKELNVTFSKYLNDVRLEKAKKLLMTTDDSAAQIALQIGYNDEKYFLRLFKKEVGLTTSEYRRMYGE